MLYLAVAFWGGGYFFLFLHSLLIALVVMGKITIFFVNFVTKNLGG